MPMPYTAIKTSGDPNKPPIPQSPQSPPFPPFPPPPNSPKSKAGSTQRDYRLLIEGLKHCYTQQEKAKG